MQDLRNPSVKVTWDKNYDCEDIEKAVMMYLLKVMGITYTDVAKVMENIMYPWRPNKIGDIYFYIGEKNTIESKEYLSDYMDAFNLSTGNYFKNYEDAKENRKTFM